MNPISRALNKIGRGIKTGVKGVGRALERRFIEPSVRVGKIQDAKMQEMSRKATAGELNY